MPRPERRRRPERPRAQRARSREPAEGGGPKPQPEAAPAAHAVWSGTLSFGLVTLPVELYSARRASATPLRMLSPDGVPLARRYLCPEEDVLLEDDEIVRGYEVAEGEFVEIEDEELEAIAPRRSRDIELVRFVDREALDPAYFVRAYFLVPAGEQTKAYRLLAETMETSGRAAIAHFVMRDKAYAVAILADAGLLRAVTLRFADELRSPDGIGLPKPPKADSRRMHRAERAIQAKRRDAIDPDELRDEASERLLALAREKLERGKDVVEVPEEAAAVEEQEGAEVVDLMALLKRRLRAPSAARRPKRAGRARSSAQDRARASAPDRARSSAPGR